MSMTSTTYMYEKKCRKCGITFVMGLTESQILELENGSDKLIQEIIPNISSGVRELFISGICGICWNKKLGNNLGVENNG